MPYLVAEVSQQRAVGLVHGDPQLFAVHVVPLGQIQCDEPVFVASEDLLGAAGEQVERQAVLGVFVSAHDGEFELDEFGDQPSLCLLSSGERGHPVGVCIAGSGARQGAGRAQTTLALDATVGFDQPIAFSRIHVRAQSVFAGVDGASLLALFATGDNQQYSLFKGVPKRAAARQATGILEGQPLAACWANEISHRIVLGVVADPPQ